MWMLIAAVGAGVFIYQFLTELLKGRYSILETRLNEIAGIGETSQKMCIRDSLSGTLDASTCACITGAAWQLI